MLFHSIDFAVFLPIVFVLYWFFCKGNLKLQNLLITIASFIFYGWWDWRFLLFIIASIVVDFGVGLQLHKTQNQVVRKRWLWFSILANLGMLGYFKYFNFFAKRFSEAFTFFGSGIEWETLNIILPIGISFYTFQTLSYTIDIYRKELKPTKDFIAFSNSGRLKNPT